MRAERTGCAHDEVYLAAESGRRPCWGHLDAVRPSLVVIDSRSDHVAGETDGVSGVTQVHARSPARPPRPGPAAMVLVGHVTKDGAIAGPRSLETPVDVVLHFEGDRNTPAHGPRGQRTVCRPADEGGLFPVARQRD